MAYRIYLVDDDRFLVSLYSTKFKNAGNDVVTFAGAEDLLAALRKEDDKRDKAPDAIIIDLIMPGIDGFTAIETMRKEKLAEGAKVIILSNEGQDADIERARALGADGYIVKASAVPSEVLTEVCRILDAKKKITHTSLS